MSDENGRGREGGAEGAPAERPRGGAPGGEKRNLSLKARLRAKARKKARKQLKKQGGGLLRKKACRFCIEPKLEIDYKEPKGLRYFISETGKVMPQRISGNCARHQRAITTAVKRARQLALLPYSSQHGG